MNDDRERLPGRRLLSVIVPARNEADNLPRAYAEITAALAGLPHRYEVLVIDNASTDGTGAAAAGLCARDRRWRYVRFSRDFGIEASLAAGFRLARGHAAVVVFSDLQDPPGLIPEMVRRWEAGHDVVYGVVRRREGDPAWKAWSAGLAYRLIGALAEFDIPPGATDFRLLSRRAMRALNRCRERYRYSRGLAHWVGFRSCGVPYDRRPRTAGRSKAAPLYLLNFLANALTCVSIRPVQAFSLAGLASSALTAVLTAVWLLGATTLTGVHLLLLANLSAVLLGVGVLGEYAGRAYLEGKRRPLYVIDRTVNLTRRARDRHREPDPRHAEL
jgi:polyisoprenyl-phosphate glycosyltransferase